MVVLWCVQTCLEKLQFLYSHTLFLRLIKSAKTPMKCVQTHIKHLRPVVACGDEALSGWWAVPGSSGSWFHPWPTSRCQSSDGPNGCRPEQRSTPVLWPWGPDAGVAHAPRWWRGPPLHMAGWVGGLPCCVGPVARGALCPGVSCPLSPGWEGSGPPN